MRAVIARHHATSPQVIGSVARGEDHVGSDLDLLVEFSDEASLLDEIGLRLELEELLEVKVDIVAMDALRGRFRDRVLDEAVPL